MRFIKKVKADSWNIGKSISVEQSVFIKAYLDL